MTLDPAPDLAVFERGWLSSNNVLLRGAEGEGATLIDSGHCLHAEQTVALVRNALGPGQALATVVNTHLHSDHCGGNAALQRAFGARLLIPPGQADAAARWDETVLSYRDTAQRIERFAHDGVLSPGEGFTVGARTWRPTRCGKTASAWSSPSSTASARSTPWPTHSI
jgi:glyoxylase-like metal-dependent hydrolase (beta-lactamase superfamily II)